ncbi:cyclic nucleotide-binding domain-containing protein [Beggiatoa leptomitoformis]|uniref:Cyclic nucleotide-binding domain-containing protein n=1 Tax=Beggiatoa leptomitoformis TaxID=288004 RepID=A0A2N9YGR1_9GAMM|nr:cyclic nucleotide-binding domain-containing protein [Beggiatoa leptomitoformis]ALG68128.1 cyclic nucleotide-binding domain-containing protein [Beggiatoa leptomitoformis]AUI69575.1 cyclic nucleotide-binding domain-containing protein [Beggiatoa leptomitoformis]
MLLTLEKVIILKTVNIFSEIPEEYLVELASSVEQIRVKADEIIFKKGDLGSSMYIIVAGKVRIHDGDKEITMLADREVFGELAALDPEPRSATVTALEDTTLFRVNESMLYELITERTEVARGIIRVLCQRLRTTSG